MATKPANGPRVWKLADAKNRLSELVNLALSEGPQHITRRGDEVVVMSRKDYEGRVGTERGSRKPLLDFILDGPSFEGVDVTRAKDGMREVEL